MTNVSVAAESKSKERIGPWSRFHRRWTPNGVVKTAALVAVAASIYSVWLIVDEARKPQHSSDKTEQHGINNNAIAFAMSGTLALTEVGVILLKNGDSDSQPTRPPETVAPPPAELPKS